MKKVLKIHAILIIFVFSLFGVILVKTVAADTPPSYQKDSSKYTYLTGDAGMCQGGILVDKYGDVINSCGVGDGSVCTTVENEVGCFIPVVSEPEVPAPAAAVAPVVPPVVAVPATVPVAPAAPAAPSCGDFVFVRNECIGCNQSRSVFQNSCGVYKTEVNPGTDSACASYNCAAAPVEPANPVAPVAPSCGATCTYSDPRYPGCFSGNCLDGSNNCSFNNNCGFVSGCSSGTSMSCPGSSTVPPVAVNPPNNAPANPPSTNNPTTTQYRVATSSLALQTAQWQPYTSGGVVISAPSSIYTVDTPSVSGQKAIYVQFMDSNNQLVKFSDGNDFYVDYINLQNPQPSATIATSPTVSGSNKTWAANLVKVNISGFNETNQTIIEVYFRNSIGMCDVSSCGFSGWTKIRSYGTNGLDQFSWTPNPGDVDPGIHMFGIFAVNASGEADRILEVSPTNYVSQ